MERWLPVAGYENYEISDHGRVRIAKCRMAKYRGVFLKLHTHYKGHLYVYLYAGSEASKKKFYVHRLVVIAFLEGFDGNEIVNHMDMNKKNNHYTNLEWTTVKGNTIHYHTWKGAQSMADKNAAF